MLIIALHLLSILRALAEVAGMSLLAQGALWLLTGGGTQRNVVYQLFSFVTRPVIGATRRLAPKAISDRFVALLAFLLLFALWIALAYVRQVVCQSNLCG
jgi:hypothetical protein